MLESGEVPGLRNPLDAFDKYAAHVEINTALLKGRFIDALSVVSDLDRINQGLDHSPKSDLVMTRQVPQMPLNSPHDIEQTINFIPKMRGFGVPVFVWDQLFERERLQGYRPYSDEQAADVYEMSGCGGYSECLAIAAELHAGHEFADRVAFNTHTGKPAFARMWTLFPELTDQLIDLCRQPEEKIEGRDDSLYLYVAYTVMSRLVDESDPGVRQPDGSYDDWALCH
jgi:hypothetical protein